MTTEIETEQTDRQTERQTETDRKRKRQTKTERQETNRDMTTNNVCFASSHLGINIYTDSCIYIQLTVFLISFFFCFVCSILYHTFCFDFCIICKKRHLYVCVCVLNYSLVKFSPVTLLTTSITT
jgi:predicted membrane channel-forming protein YqfA (hemolysin III family)